MRCLIIDNYDSFTWNLADYVAQTFGSQPLVVRNDQYTWREITDLDSFGCILVSPGPGSVTNPNDFNVSRDALEQDDVPVLGVCLGHQGLAYVYGGAIKHAPIPFHGRTSTIHHDGSGLFQGLPMSFKGVRYHSLVVCPESLPAQLVVTARTECGLIMGLRHVSRPKWGVQFHPESILTSHGMRIISNFRDEAYRYAKKNIAPRRLLSIPCDSIAGGAAESDRDSRGVRERRRELQTFTRHLTTVVDPEKVFLSLYADRDNCFWLDSQSVSQGMSQFSFMGCAAQGALLTYGAADVASDAGGERYLAALERALEGTFVRCVDELPFEFHGGYIGYMSYEMKAALGAATTHRNAIPDAVWMHVDRFLAFDHQSGDVWLVAVAEPEECASVLGWMDATSEALKSLPHSDRAEDFLGLRAISVSMDFGREDYLAAIEHCKEKIVDGESYEVCLTNSFKFDQKLDPVALYLAMRRGNPAPFGAFIRVREDCVLSTSPERFLKVDANGTVQTKPIKGTCARSDDPIIDRKNAAGLAASEKDQAENLMIVDLMRNDLGRVSVPGSVTVPKLMDIESFKTVHQMVSTVESTLKPECSLVDLLRAVFPGGSITGAPKIRTMEIIDRLERSPRGIYCGTIGYLGYNRIADLNIAIRTLSYDGTTVRFGAGGAITYLSQPEEEFQEILLKAEAVLRPIWQYVNGAGVPFEYHLRDRTLCLEESSPRAAHSHGSETNIAKFGM
ncbi:MAG: aminodeoxychorismate synthase component I [Myxococcales bacterium]|nr:aminodeoxychorismate synthase component I [Myxococcales bacterium]